MNKKRRKHISALVDQLGNISNELDDILDEEQEYFDNMPDSIQDGEKGETAQSAITNLETARDSISEVIEQLNEATE